MNKEQGKIFDRIFNSVGLWGCGIFCALTFKEGELDLFLPALIVSLVFFYKNISGEK